MYINANDYYQQKAAKQESEARADLLHLILFAANPEEVARAQQLRDVWIELNPDDDEILEASETLEMMAEGYATRAAQ